jgi:hypothetical protein
MDRAFFPKHHRWIFILFDTRITVLRIKFFFDLKGNGLVIFLAIKFKKLNDMTNFYIFNLAITDLLFVLFCIPFTTYVYLGGDWIFGQIPCKLSHFFSSVRVFLGYILMPVRLRFWLFKYFTINYLTLTKILKLKK